MAVAIACGVLVWAFFVVFMAGEPLVAGIVVSIALGAVVWWCVFTAGLVVRDSIDRRGMWGINFKRRVCSQCGTPMRRLTHPTWREVAYGGWTCHECGLELNQFGRPWKTQVTLAKWAVFRAAGDTDEREHWPRLGEERIQNVNDQTQRGDA
jgi:hypothetical protein